MTLIVFISKLKSIFLLLIIFYTNTGYGSPYTLIETLNHDATCFTQGLVYEGQYLYESCGLNGESVVKKFLKSTHTVIQSISLPNEIFAEGLVYYKGFLFLLTWMNKKVYILNADTMSIIGIRKIFTSTKEGWGLTHNEKHLIITDGSHRLMFYDFPDINSLQQSSTTKATKSSSNIFKKVYEVTVKQYPDNTPVHH